MQPAKPTKLALWTLCLHAAWLIMASTRFSLVGWIWGGYAWTWEYFQYSYKNGWGYQYRSDYSPVVVLTYIAAFFAGLIGYGVAWKHLSNGWTRLAAILSALGLISFLVEGGHWLWSYHLSWIVICPAGSVLLVGVVIIQLRGGGGKPVELTTAPNGGPAPSFGGSGVTEFGAIEKP